MKPMLLILATLTAVLLGITATDEGDREVCVARAPNVAGKQVGYELIDVMRREAWVTTHWTVEAYSEFSPGIGAFYWIKNDPRQGFAARTTALRSPGCAADGEFTYQSMHDRTFFHIADLRSFRGQNLTNGALTEARVDKHHRLEFDAGQTVSFLVSPLGDHFVRVNRPIDAREGNEALPDGWALRDIALADPWTADLVGEVAVLRLENGVSYQGPVGPLPQAAAKTPSQPRTR